MREIDRTPVKEPQNVRWIDPIKEEIEITSVPWSKPDIGHDEIGEVRRVMDSGWVTQGPETEKFERMLARYLRCRYVVCVSSGSAALVTALLAHGAKHAVIPSYCFFATLNACKMAGVMPMFNDINPKNVHMIPERVEDGRSDLYYVPVSYAGLALNREEWIDLPVIEDAAESFGAEDRAIHTGAQGWTAIFSFHAAKLITTVEGGAIATDDTDIYERLKIIRKGGEDPDKYWIQVMPGLNFKTTDIASAIGICQLRKVNKYLENRFRISIVYEKGLGDLVDYQDLPEYKFRHANMMFPIFVDDPFTLSKELKKKGVDTRPGWPPLMETENSNYVYNHVICLPIYNSMRVEEAEYVIKCVKESL